MTPGNLKRFYHTVYSGRALTEINVHLLVPCLSGFRNSQA